MASGLTQCQGIFCGLRVTGRWAKMCGLAENRQRRRKDGPASFHRDLESGDPNASTEQALLTISICRLGTRFAALKSSL